MTKYLLTIFLSLIYKKTVTKSEIVTQMIYGESFSISKKNNKWLKLKLKKIIIKVIFNVKIIRIFKTFP